MSAQNARRVSRRATVGAPGDRNFGRPERADFRRRAIEPPPRGEALQRPIETTQYCCHDYLAQLHALRMIPSMTDAAHCYQNAVAERVDGILKDEFDLDTVFPSLTTARHAVARAVEIYNTIRTHWSLELHTPHAVFHEAA